MFRLQTIKFLYQKKTSFVWGQIISHKDYNSKLGFCFKDHEGESEKLKLLFMMIGV